MKVLVEDVRVAEMLWRLRRRELADSVPLAAMAEIMDVDQMEAAILLKEVRTVLPAALTTSLKRASLREAEVAIALHATLGHRDEAPIALQEAARLSGAPIEELQALLPLARERLAFARGMGHYANVPRTPIEDFGAVVGENPRSWTIMWIVLAAIALIFGTIAVFGR
ncbi:hypothetical protein [Fimbriimonas ginsengisoli]|uniref:Uncharacterized protein n=1 Tax=Fimbriimonas ginsengisoli Gsoil 348 TaxID=661478 RepID=A0A068NU09_FIMGI|nr:hypothetical protein [Fimbriimonas ginsengisoli]AIE85054.1 hypothetical protein OP10G_1686 [Fimbriimonas ginsengisoli Gsoil 348]